MKALLFQYNLARVAYARLASKISPYALLRSPGPLTLTNLPDASLPAQDWAIVRTRLCGICGSDVKQVFLDGNMDNPLTGLISFPHVLGHEASGVVEKAGTAVKALQVGQRVVLNPWLSCLPRGVQPVCDACQRGEYSQCTSFTGGRLSPAMHIGNCRDVTGGFATLFAAHESQLFPIPDRVSYEQAVLSDPFSVSLHAILKAPPAGDQTALVFGCGTLGLLTIAILRALYPNTTVIAIARYSHQAQAARQLGAQHVITTRKPTEIIQTIADIMGSRPVRPWNGLPMLLRGVGVIYDTIGSPQTLEIGLRLASPHARDVITGVAMPRRFEWTPLYFKEIEVIGSNAFGIETFQGERLHAMQIYLRLVDEGRLDLAHLITHRFGLDQYTQAFLTAHNKDRYQAIKVVFDFQ